MSVGTCLDLNVTLSQVDSGNTGSVGPTYSKRTGDQSVCLKKVSK